MRRLMKKIRKGSWVTRQIVDYIEVIVALVLAPLIFAYWTNFRDSVPAEYQSFIDALTVVLVMGLAASVIGKMTQ